VQDAQGCSSGLQDRQELASNGEPVALDEAAPGKSGSASGCHRADGGGSTGGGPSPGYGHVS
jgi:hypothetical protein